MKTSCWLRSQNAHPLLPRSPHLCSCISASRPGGGEVVRGKKRYPVMLHHEGGEFASCSPLPPLRHPGASQTPSLVSEHVWFGPFSVSHTFFFFFLHFRCRSIEPTVSCDHSRLSYFFTIPTTFLFVFLYGEHSIEFCLPFWHHNLHPCHFSL